MRGKVALLLLLLMVAVKAGWVLWVENPNSVTLRDFQVRVKLPAELDGMPISITYNGKPVPFCYETFTGECKSDPNMGNGYIWVKVPYIPANGKVILKVNEGYNGATSGEEVFDFYEDFDEYSSGPLSSNYKWTVSRYANDYSHECVIDNGVLWLVKSSIKRGCNIMANNFKLKYYSKAVIEFSFLVDYYKGYVNDGDGLTIVIDGKSNKPWYGCSSGFYYQNQGIDININTDQWSTGSVSISKTPEACSIGWDDLSFAYASPKKHNLDYGIVKVTLTGSEVIVSYKDMDPIDGFVKVTIRRSVWNPYGNGYFMIGAGDGWSSGNNPDSSHGIDWIRVRKYAPKEPEAMIVKEVEPVTVTRVVTTTKTVLVPLTYVVTKYVVTTIPRYVPITVRVPTYITITSYIPKLTTITTTAWYTTTVTKGYTVTKFVPIVINNVVTKYVTLRDTITVTKETTIILTSLTTTTVTKWVQVPQPYPVPYVVTLTTTKEITVTSPTTIYLYRFLPTTVTTTTTVTIPTTSVVTSDEVITVPTYVVLTQTVLTPIYITSYIFKTTTTVVTQWITKTLYSTVYTATTTIYTIANVVSTSTITKYIIETVTVAKIPAPALLGLLSYLLFRRKKRGDVSD
ncbi:hypothetical protein IPA_02520 [Ignicoccus pacificus DSM 13166]|uniref:DUF2341 domain-containing protein n=1 Tax=Ignicoccus pacificus DSM 13166 TaxID=940294 RepID=A0A977PJX0_9CREN|nr:hypothetical protein IPA_02520 [Ignicoccus pacificus DSM 13166]